jgi:hypothetical protein
LNSHAPTILICLGFLLIGILLFQQDRQSGANKKEPDRQPESHRPSLPVQSVADVKIDGEKVFSILGKDALRSIDKPEFVKASDADISDGIPVIGITDGKIARAYSIYLLDRHEIVNDQIGAHPIAITW